MTLRPHIQFYDGTELILEGDMAIVPTPHKGQTWVFRDASTQAQSVYEIGEVEIVQPYRRYPATETIPERCEALAGWKTVVQLYRVAT